MARKLAIAISGAVSLGSFEAGVMYEVLEAIAKYNNPDDPNDKPDEANRIEIDVITGASAGGMTAGILAQKLLCDGERLSGAYTNPLYASWVQEVDIEKLLAKDREKYKFSLLSSEVVESIGKRYIEDEPPVNESHHSVASDIYVGIAMSNLNGWDDIARPLNVQGDSEFTYTRYKDRFVCKLSKADKAITLSEAHLLPKKDPDPDGKNKDQWVTNWKELRECSLSSGAFPFAFEAKKITRCQGKGEFSGRKKDTYTYTDGGVFENEPLGLAKKLAEYLDERLPKLELGR
ncbi:MAG: patatin-like phospholipase family protein [Pseudanabaena sp.]